MSHCNLTLLPTISFVLLAMIASAPSAHGGSAHDGCAPYYDGSIPKFRVGKKYRLTAGTGGLAVDVGMSPKNFDQEKVTTLVCHIAKMYPNEPALFVHVFDSLRAAKAYVPGGEDYAGISYRGMYSYYDPDFEQHLSW